MSLSKTKSQKSMLWPLFQKWGLSKLQNEILTKNSTLSHRHELVLLEFKPNLWISKLNWCQKYPFSEISGEKNHSLRQASHQNFRNNPFISLFRQSQAGKRLQSFEVQPKDFPKSMPPSCQSLPLSLKSELVSRNPLKNTDMWKVGTSELLVPNFAIF